jgi:hypothetical protein
VALLLAILLLIAPSNGVRTRAQSEVVASPDGELTLLSDGQFVYGPNVAGFDAIAWIKEASPTLAPL